MKIFDTPIDERTPEPHTAADMSVVGNLFAIRIVKGDKGKISSSGYLAEFFVEDDEWYHFKISCDATWLGDLIRIAERAENLYCNDIMYS